jgi:hypothetical protein
LKSKLKISRVQLSGRSNLSEKCALLPSKTRRKPPMTQLTPFSDIYFWADFYCRIPWKNPSVTEEEFMMTVFSGRIS